MSKVFCFFFFKKEESFLLWAQRLDQVRYAVVERDGKVSIVENASED
jgi:hypothetical protein